MRAGLRAYDADTHVNPCAEVLDRYVDPDFRRRLPELAPYRTITGQIGGTPDTHQYRVDTKSYRRVLAKDVPVDHPDLEPIWQAAQEHDLPVVHHSLTWNPPYFPGYQDLWDNIFLGRLASHPWGGMRFMAAFIGAGIMDRYPSLRMGILECGFGWLPFWAKRMDEQAVYVGG